MAKKQNVTAISTNTAFVRDLTETHRLEALSLEQLTIEARTAERDGRLGFYRMARALDAISENGQYRELKHKKLYDWARQNGFSQSEASMKSILRVGRFGNRAGITEDLALAIGQERMLAMVPLVLGKADENRLGKFSHLIDQIIGKIITDGNVTVITIRDWVKAALVKAGLATESTGGNTGSSESGSESSDPLQDAIKSNKYPDWKRAVLRIVNQCGTFDEMMAELGKIGAKSGKGKASKPASAEVGATATAAA